MTTLSAHYQSSVRRMISEGKDALTVRAVFRAVPERSREAEEAFQFAQSLLPEEVAELKSSLEDEKLSRKLVRAERSAPRVAPARTATKAPTEVKVDKTPKKRKSVEGISVTALIRWCAFHAIVREDITRIIFELTDEVLHPGTLAIQNRAGLRGTDIPKLSSRLVRRIADLK